MSTLARLVAAAAAGAAIAVTGLICAGSRAIAAGLTFLDDDYDAEAELRKIYPHMTTTTPRGHP